MSDAIGRYIQFLVEQLQKDMSVVYTPWVHWTIVPLFVYFAFFCLKWWMLLAPVTVPLTTWMICRDSSPKALFKKN